MSILNPSLDFETPAGAAAKDAVVAASKQDGFGTFGGTYEDFAWMGNPVIIAHGPDADGREYHAFVAQGKIGNELWMTFMTATGHASIDGDLVILKSADYGKTWVEKHRFEATNPAGLTMVVGDYEWRSGHITDLGGGVWVCMLDKLTVVTGDDLTSPFTYGTEGRRSWYSLSMDGGETWAEPVQMPEFAGSVTTARSVSGYGEVVWKGHYYAAFYSSNVANCGIMRCTVASLRAGVPQWEKVSGNFLQECFVMVNPNDADELWVVGRYNDTYVGFKASTDGLTWSAVRQSWYGLLAESSVGIKPQMALTENGNWIFANRYTTSDITGEIITGADPFPLYSFDGNPDDELWPVKRNREFPNPFSRYNDDAWSGVWKSMYYAFVPLQGDLVATAAAYEAREQNTSSASSLGNRSSVMFGYYGAGEGLTPFGDFSPAEVELKGTAITSRTPPSVFAWMTADTEYTVAGGVANVALELFGDWTPSFTDGVDPIAPTGAYDMDARNIALISEGAVTIINAPPLAPSEIPGLREKVLMQLSPAGLVLSGSDVVSWTNEGDTDYVTELTAGTTEPTVALAATDGGANALQGASAAWMDNAGGDVPVSEIHALIKPPATTWPTGFQAVVTNAIQGGAAAGATWNVNTPWAAQYRFKNGVYDNPAAAPANEWMRIAMRQRTVTDGSGANWSELSAASLSVMFNQTGFTGTRGFTGLVGALVLIKARHYSTNRQAYLIDKWERSL